MSLNTTVAGAGVALDSASLYAWSFEGAPDLFRVPLNGGASTVVTTALPTSVTDSVVIDGATAYVGGYELGLFALRPRRVEP